MVRRKPATPRPAVQTGIRFPADLLRHIEAFAAAKSKATGIPVNRTEAIVYLVRRGLEAEGGTKS